MKNILTAIALTIAIPAMAHAQPAAPAKADCCDKMKGECKMDCCKGMAKGDKPGAKDAGDPHAGHDMSKPAAQHNH